ncbi:hypothetical protein E4U55_003335 [Claviceps digitariae]|nr:hypothetical protein E4U55_003335 [Claviceps digitariae]
MTLSLAELEELSATDVHTPLTPEVVLRAITTRPFIFTKSIFNLRDLGAVPGSRLIEKRFYRSGLLEGAAKDPQALAWLAAHVTRVFDLRQRTEREGAPDPVVPGVENIWLDEEPGYKMPELDEYACGGGEEAWKKEYMNCAMAYRPTIRAVLEHVRDRPTEPILFHCTAGRDRTGVLAGLLHALADTPLTVITRDYMLSRIGTEPARQKLLQYAMSTMQIKDPDTPGFYNLVSLRPEFWRAFQDGMVERFGGWDGYVTAGLGFSEADLAVMKENLRS